MDRYRPIPSPTDSDTLACLSVLVKIQHNLLECHDSETLFASLLPDIRLAACTSYAYFFRNVPLFDGQPTYSLVAESHLPNLPPRKDRPNFALLPHAHLPNWTATLMNHGLVFGTPNDFAGEERFFMSLMALTPFCLCLSLRASSSWAFWVLTIAQRRASGPPLTRHSCRMLPLRWLMRFCGCRLPRTCSAPAKKRRN